MAYKLDGSNPLSYMGVTPTQPPDLIIQKRQPATSDTNFNLGTLWVIGDSTTVPSQEVWCLVGNKRATGSTWAQLFPGAGDGATSFPTDVGTATEAGGDLNIVGGTNINTAGAGNTVTVNLDNAITLTGNITTTTGDVIVTAGDVMVTAGHIDILAGGLTSGTSISAGTFISATTNVISGAEVQASTGISTAGGDIVATAGAVNAGTSVGAATTVTAGTGITSTTGNIVATAGAINAGTTMTAGTGATVTTGDLITTTGNVQTNGITFDGGTNTLDTYVARTAFTPVLSFGGASTGITYAAQEGEYARIGSMVFVSLFVELTSKGSATGNMAITGFPYTGSIYTQPENIVAPVRWGRLTYTGTLTGILRASLGTFIVSQVASGGDHATLTNTSFSNSSWIEISCSYFVS